jgi:glycosyltransferase involved in cell wall biosynthesis
LKILFLSHSFYPFIGGIETISEILARAFTTAGHEVHLLTWTTDSSGKVFPFEVLRNPVKRVLLREHLWSDLVFENNPCMRLAWPGLLFGRPSVIALHTWISRVDGRVAPIDKLKMNWWLKHAKRVIAVSQALKTRCWPNATIIGNPYGASQFKTIPGMVKTGEFVYLGRLVSDKGVHLAIKAVYQLRNAMPPLDFIGGKPILTIIGEGPERYNLEQLAAELDVGDCIRFTGSLRGEELVKCLNRHRFLLVPSAWEEPFGVVALEGIACSCIPVVSDGGGLPDAIGNAGITFKRGNVESLVESVSKVMQSPALEKQLLDAAANHLTAFHPDNIAGQYLNVLENVMNLQ